MNASQCTLKSCSLPGGQPAFEAALEKARLIVLPAFEDNYIFALETCGRILVVDPGEARPVLRFLETLPNPDVSILLTHHHADHIAGVSRLRKTLPISAIYGPDDPRIDGITHPLKHGDSFHWADYIIHGIGTPGHTRTHLAYYLPDLRLIFTGDALFTGGCGRLFEGNGNDLLITMNRLRTLPKNSLIFCAHEYTLENLEFARHIEPDNQDVIDRLHTVHLLRKQNIPAVPGVLEEETAINPFLRTDVDAVCRSVGTPPDRPDLTLAALRRAKDQWG